MSRSPLQTGALITGLVLLALSLHPNHESDPFWHMSLGRAVLATGSRVVPEPTALRAFTDPAVAPEWLWDVTSWGLYQAGGWTALSGLVAGLALVLGALLWRYAGALVPATPGEPAGMRLAVVLAGAVLVSARLRLRPENAGLVAMLAVIVLAHGFREAPGWRRGAAIFGVQALWAQVHGSFVLGPTLLVIVAGTPSTAFLALLAGAGLACLTSAYGVHVAGYILAHSGGDAVRHVLDMMAPTLSTLDDVYGLAFVGLWALGLFGLAAGSGGLATDGLATGRGGPGATGAGALRTSLLAAFGAALLGSAVRFLVVAGVLALPLALRGALLLGRRRGAGALALLAALGLVGAGAETKDDHHGPLGTIGLAEDDHPLAGAALLAQAAGEPAVYASYKAAAQIGFLTGGKARVTTDGRTPLYFDDTDFALFRDALARPEVLRRAIDHLGITAFVLNRDRPECQAVPAEFAPAVVEASYTTFLPVADLPGHRLPLNACGGEYIAEGACDAGTLPDAVRALRALHDGAFADYLEAEYEVRCLANPDPPTLPPVGLTRAWGPQYRRLLARIAILRHDPEAAVDAVEADVRSGDLAALATVGAALFGGVPPARAVDVLEDTARALDDSTPSALRADLANLCVQTGDAECVRFEGLRAAQAGEASVAPALAWLAVHHPDARVRADAAGWRF